MVGDFLIQIFRLNIGEGIGVREDKLYYNISINLLGN